MNIWGACIVSSQSFCLFWIYAQECDCWIIQQLYFQFFKEPPYCSPDNTTIGRVMPPALFFFLRIALIILGLLWFHIYFKIIYSSFVENVMSNLIEIALNLQIALSSMAILMILILPIQENGISFHFFASFSISFINTLQLSVYRSFTSLVRFIPSYFLTPF